MAMTPFHATSGRLARYRRLPRGERRVLLQALGLLPLNWIALRVMGYRRWRALLAARLPAVSNRRAAEAQPSAITAKRLAQLVYAASREGLLTGACLERSLALWWLLRGHSFPAELRIGGRKDGARFQAHAWVELDGLALNETGPQDYVPFEPSAELSKVKFV